MPIPQPVSLSPTRQIMKWAGGIVMRALLLSIALAFCGAVLPLSAQAVIVRYELNIPRQPLDAALKEFAAQTGLQIARFSDSIDGRALVGPLTGRHSAESALKTLLSPQGLSYKMVNDRTIAVVNPNDARSLALQEAYSPESGASGSGAGTQGSLPPAAQGDERATAQSDSTPPASTTQGQENERLGELVVTGTRLRGVATDRALPLRQYSEKQIDESGQPSLAGFLSTLNEVSVTSSMANVGGSNLAYTGASTVQLRGLPVGSTLVLLNGRRVQAAGQSNDLPFFNLELVPLDAIERVDVLPLGSSAIYGGDALGGVVNVVLKSSGDGISGDLRYGFADGADDLNASLTVGQEFRRGSFFALAGYTHTSPLQTTERELLRNADYTRFGGPDRRSRTCGPGNVTSTTGANLPGLDAAVAGIPATGSSAPPVVADFLPTSGLPNLCARSAVGNGRTLVYGGETGVIHVTGSFDFTPDWSLFTELGYNNAEQRAEEEGVSILDTVPATNAFNPFGEDVDVRTVFAPENGITGLGVDTEAVRALLGVRGAIGTDWDLEVAASTSRDESRNASYNGNIDFVALADALAAADPALALNPFAIGPAASDAVLRSIWTDLVFDREGRKDVVTGFIRGQLLHLPAGTVEVVVGAEWAKDYWASILVPGEALIDVDRESQSAFAEARVPLLEAPGGNSGDRDFVSLSLAGRYDAYSDFGSASTYQAGLEVRPVSGLLLRGALVTSFKPPSLVQMNPSGFEFPLEFFGLTDPLRGDEPITSGTLRGGPNPFISAEEGEATSFGLVWAPRSLPGARFEVTRWNTDIADQITFPNTQFVLLNEAFLPGFVTREPPTDGTPGRIIEVLSSYVNLGEVKLSGVDVDATYALSRAWGQWSFGAGASHTDEYSLRVSPLTSAENRLGVFNQLAWAPEWKGRASVGLAIGAWNLSLSARYLGSYSDGGSPAREAGDNWIHDAAATLDLGNLVRRIGIDTQRSALSISVVNIGDEQPEFINVQPFFDGTQTDWRGRYVTLRVSSSW